MYVYAIMCEEESNGLPALYLIQDTAEEDAEGYRRNSGKDYTVHELFVDEGFPVGRFGGAE